MASTRSFLRVNKEAFVRSVKNNQCENGFLYTIGDEKLGIRNEFDAKADIYDSYRLAGWYHAHNDAIAAHLDLGTDDRLLDIGCGTGYLIRKVLAAEPEATAVGVDLSPRMIETAQHLSADLGDRAAYVYSDWEQPDNVLSARLAQWQATHAVCSSVLHYFSDPVGALRRIRRALIPGGAFFLLERRMDRSVATQAWDIAHRRIIKDHVRFYDTAELLEMLDQAGFMQAEVVETIRKFFWKNKMSTNLSLIKAVT